MSTQSRDNHSHSFNTYLAIPAASSGVSIPRTMRTMTTMARFRSIDVRFPFLSIAELLVPLASILAGCFHESL